MPTGYSLLMAVFWFSLLGGVLAAVRRRNLPLRYGLIPVLFLGILLLIRVFFAFELPFTQVLDSDWVLVQAQRFWTAPFLFLSVGQWLLCVWLAGAAIGIVRFWLRLAQDMKGLKRLPRACSPQLEQAVQKAAEKELDIVVTETATVPYVAGFFKPTVVLPAFDYDVEMLELILRHEYQHFLNRDQWKKTLIHLVRLLFWWNPMAILVQKEMDQTLELLCDYRTLKKLPPERHCEYFSAILKLCRQAIEQKKAVFSFAALALKGFGCDARSLLQQRIEVGLALQKNRPLRDRIVAALICVALAAIFALSYAVVFQPRYPAPEMEDGYVILGSEDLQNNMILVERNDGLYEVFVNNISTGTIQDISQEPFASAPIISEKIWKWGKLS